MPEGRRAVKHHDARLGRGIEGLDGLHDRRRRQFALEDGADEIDARHRCHDFRRRHAEFDGGGGVVVHAMVPVAGFNDDYHTKNLADAPAMPRHAGA